METKLLLGLRLDCVISSPWFFSTEVELGHRLSDSCIEREDFEPPESEEHDAIGDFAPNAGKGDESFSQLCRGEVLETFESSLFDLLRDLGNVFGTETKAELSQLLFVFDPFRGGEVKSIGSGDSQILDEGLKILRDAGNVRYLGGNESDKTFPWILPQDSNSFSCFEYGAKSGLFSKGPADRSDRIGNSKEPVGKIEGRPFDPKSGPFLADLEILSTGPEGERSLFFLPAEELSRFQGLF